MHGAIRVAMIAEGSRDARREWPDRELAIRRVEQHAFDGRARRVIWPAARLLESPSTCRPAAIPQPEGGGDRNAIPLYALSNSRRARYFIPDMPLRVSALRALGAIPISSRIESFHR